MDAARILLKSLPLDHDQLHKLLTIEELNELLDAKRKQYASKIVSGDVHMAYGGYVDTTRGAALNSAEGLQVSLVKANADATKRRENRLSSMRQELRAAQRRNESAPKLRECSGLRGRGVLG